MPSLITTILENRLKVALIISLCGGLLGYLAYLQGKKQEKLRQNKKNSQQVYPYKIQEQHLLHDSLHNSREVSEAGDRTHRYHQQHFHLYGQFYFDKDSKIHECLDKLDKFGINVENIYMFSPMTLTDEFESFNREIRNRRRLIKGINEDQYVAIVLDFEHEVEELLKRGREEIVEQEQIDPSEFERMTASYQTTEDLGRLLRNAKSQLKRIFRESKKAEAKQVPIKVLRKILKEVVYFCESKNYDRLRNKLQSKYQIGQDEILKVIVTLIDDIIFEKFGFEREDYQKAIEENEEKLQKEIKQYRKSVQQLQADISNFGYESFAESENSNVQIDGQSKKSKNQTRSNSLAASMNEDSDN